MNPENSVYEEWAKEEEGFFGLVGGIWAEADRKRGALKEAHGEDLGEFIANINQYGAAWTGDVWEWTAIGAEEHIAFATIPPTHPWDTENYGWVVTGGFTFSADGTAESSGIATRRSYTSGWGGWTKPHNPGGAV